MRILHASSKGFSYEGVPVCLDVLKLVFKERRPDLVVFSGDHFPEALKEVARLALAHKVTMEARSPATFDGMDHFVT